MKRKQKEPKRNVILLDDFRKEVIKRREEEKAQLFSSLVTKIYGILNRSIDYTNIDYVAGQMLNYAETLSCVYNKPGVAEKRMKQFNRPSIAESAKKIREKNGKDVS